MGVSVEPEIVHAPDTFVHEIEPVPLPPLAVRESETPIVPLVDETESVGWFAFCTVIDVFEDVAELYEASAALVAVSTQDEPTSPGVSVPPFNTQVPETYANVTAPDPEPPVVASDSG